MKKGLIIILSGPSGVGKGTIRKKIINKPELNLSYSISMTTRAPRNGEKDGKDYYFVSMDEFNHRIEKNEFLEYCEFVGNKYGTPKDKIEELRNQGKNVFVEIEVIGATQVMEKLKDDPGLVTIFLLPPSIEELEERIRGRKSEDEETIKARLTKARGEMNLANLYQYNVINRSLPKACQMVKDIILTNIKKNNQ